MYVLTIRYKNGFGESHLFETKAEALAYLNTVWENDKVVSTKLSHN